MTQGGGSPLPQTGAGGPDDGTAAADGVALVIAAIAAQDRASLETRPDLERSWTYMLESPPGGRTLGRRSDGLTVKGSGRVE